MPADHDSILSFLMNKSLFSSLLIGCALLTACRKAPLDEFQGTSPAMNFQEFFEGKTRGYGQIYAGGSLSGEFVVDINGYWRGDSLIMAEHFRFRDGREVKREWAVKKTALNRFEATADDVKKKAEGESAGRAVRFRYRMDIEKFTGSSRTVDFEDWMFQQSPTLVLNRAVLRKWGISVGEMIAVFEKVSE